MADEQSQKWSESNGSVKAEVTNSITNVALGAMSTPAAQSADAQPGNQVSNLVHPVQEGTTNGVSEAAAQPTTTQTPTDAVATEQSRIALSQPSKTESNNGDTNGAKVTPTENVETVKSERTPTNEGNQPAKKKYLGVIERRSGGGKVYWEANGYVNSTTKYLGSFTTPEEAASTYDNFLASNISTGQIVLGRWNRKRRYNFPERILKLYTDETSEARQLALTQLGRGTLGNMYEDGSHRAAVLQDGNMLGHRNIQYADVGTTSLGVRPREEDLYRNDSQYPHKYMRTAGGGYGHYYGGTQMQMTGYPTQGMPMTSVHVHGPQVTNQQPPGQHATFSGHMPYEPTYDPQPSVAWYNGSMQRPAGEGQTLTPETTQDVYANKMMYQRTMGLPGQYDPSAYPDIRGHTQGVSAAQVQHVPNPAAYHGKAPGDDASQATAGAPVKFDQGTVEQPHSSAAVHAMGAHGGYGQQSYMGQEMYPSYAGRPTAAPGATATFDNTVYSGWLGNGGAAPRGHLVGVTQIPNGRWKAAAIVYNQVQEIGVFDDSARAGEAYDDYLCNFIANASLTPRDITKFQFNYPARVVGNPNVSLAAKDLARVQMDNSRRAHNPGALAMGTQSVASPYPNASQAMVVGGRNVGIDNSFRPDASTMAMGDRSNVMNQPVSKVGYSTASPSDVKGPTTAAIMSTSGTTPNYAAYYQMNGQAGGMVRPSASVPSAIPGQDSVSQMTSYYGQSQFVNHATVQSAVSHGLPSYVNHPSPTTTGQQQTLR